jgi:hypothetical protein
VNFKHRFNHKDQGDFTMPRKADIEYPFEHGKVSNYTLDGVSIHPVVGDEGNHSGISP